MRLTSFMLFAVSFFTFSVFAAIIPPNAIGLSGEVGLLGNGPRAPDGHRGGPQHNNAFGQNGGILGPLIHNVASPLVSAIAPIPKGVVKAAQSLGGFHPERNRPRPTRSTKTPPTPPPTDTPSSPNPPSQPPDSPPPSNSPTPPPVNPPTPSDPSPPSNDPPTPSNTSPPIPPVNPGSNPPLTGGQAGTIGGSSSQTDPSPDGDSGASDPNSVTGNNPQVQSRPGSGDLGGGNSSSVTGKAHADGTTNSGTGNQSGANGQDSPNGRPSSPSSPKAAKSSNVPAILGGLFGSLVLIALIVLCCRRFKVQNHLRLKSRLSNQAVDSSLYFQPVTLGGHAPSPMVEDPEARLISRPVSVVGSYKGLAAPEDPFKDPIAPEDPFRDPETQSVRSTRSTGQDSQYVIVEAYKDLAETIYSSRSQSPPSFIDTTGTASSSDHSHGISLSTSYTSHTGIMPPTPKTAQSLDLKMDLHNQMMTLDAALSSGKPSNKKVKEMRKSIQKMISETSSPS